MALFDKVKAQAQDVAKKAQEAGRVGQAKIDEFQSKRQLDSAYRDLGEAYYHQRTGAPGASEAAVDTAVDAVEAQIHADADGSAT